MSAELIFAQKCQCKNGGTCDRVTGQCECRDNYYGATCSLTCPSATYGPGCNQV